MTFYVTSPNFDVLSLISNFLQANNHRENILMRTIHKSRVAQPLQTGASKYLAGKLSEMVIELLCKIKQCIHKFTFVNPE